MEYPYLQDKTHSNVCELSCWQRLMQVSNSVQKDRKIKAYQPDMELPTNQIQTSKYTPLTFVPKNLFEQFTKPANLYFLIVGILQAIPLISSTEGVPVMFMPLTFIVTITAIKDLYEDRKRAISDKLENEELIVQVLDDNSEVIIKSKQVRVGMVVKVKKNETIPCDGIIIDCSNHCAYVETKNLDGQTNLKRKIFMKDIAKYRHDQTELRAEYEKPSASLNSFNGSILVGEEKIIIHQNAILLRSTKLKNTDYVHLLVIYTGPDTRILKCMTKPTTKRSTIQKRLSDLNIIIVVFIVSISLTLAVLRSKFGVGSLLPHSKINFFLINWTNWMLNLTNLIPISMTVTLEFVKLLQGKLLHYDHNMKSAEFRSVANSSNLAEDLGVIQVVASDKTGTLTKNSLIMRVIGNGDIIYNEQSPTIDNKILRMLCICHTSYISSEGQFESMSQDQICILNFCSAKGCRMKYRDEQTLVLNQQKDLNRYRILHTVEFTSDRKKQSTLFETEGQYYVVSKGADTSMAPHLIDNVFKINVLNQVNRFAEDGYRTLVYGFKKVGSETCQHWLGRMKLAKNQQNLHLIMQLEAQIQDNLVALCATGIQDQLQEDVRDTIKSIIDANIKFMIISGDKPQTVLSIAKNLNVCTDPYLAPTNEFRSQYLDKQLVVFARCTPKEKQLIVSKIPLNTLAIGDGANDVSMITRALVGVGVAGKEGKAAVQASDFGIPEFKYLKPLLFYYGRQYNRKNAELVKYNFYKNFVNCLPLIVYGFYSSYTGVFIYQKFIAQLYNVIFTSVPIVAYALFDEQEDQAELVANVSHYSYSKNQVYFSKTSILLSFIESFVLGCVPLIIILHVVSNLWKSPLNLNVIDVGSVLLFFVVIQCNLRIVIMVTKLTAGLAICVVVSIISFVISYYTCRIFIEQIQSEDFHLLDLKCNILVFICLLFSVMVSCVSESIKTYCYKRMAAPVRVDKEPVYIELS